MSVLVVLLVACGHSPTAPSPPVTWTISPTSAVMHEGDVVVFHINSSGPAEVFPTCYIAHAEGVLWAGELRVANNLEPRPTIGSRPAAPTTGDCTVTLVRLYQTGRAFLRVVELLGVLPFVERVNLEAAIDVAQ